MRPLHSLDQLKNAGKPRIGVSPPAVYVSSPDVKSEWKFIEKHLLRAIKGARNPNLNVAFTKACAAVV